MRKGLALVIEMYKMYSQYFDFIKPYTDLFYKEIIEDQL